VQLHIGRHLPHVLGVGVLALALPLVTAGAAHADKGGERCGNARIVYSLDGGQTWTDKGRMDGRLVTRIEVKFGEERTNHCEYAVSLASYSAEGPTWPTSGTQAFLGWDSKKLSKENPRVTLDVSAYAPPCFGQVDLYGNGRKYDGKENPLPHHPDAGFPTDLITAWNGGSECEQPTTPPPTRPSEPPVETTKPPVETTEPPTQTTAPPTGSTKPPAESTKPPAGSTKPPASTERPVKPTKSATTTPPVVQEPAGTPPVGKPEVIPIADTSPASLAETGSDNTGAIAIGTAAGVLLVGGLGAFAWSRRRDSGGTPA